MNVQRAFLDEIDSAVVNSSSARRADIVRHLADLYLVNVDQYSDAEVDLIDDVLVRLVVTIEETARVLLAIRLAPNAKAPPKILKALACDDAIDVASPVLIHALGLDETTLIECARTKSQEHLLSISRRKTLPESVTDILLERGDQQVLLSTAQNDGAKFSGNGFAILVDRARGDDLLAASIGGRSDLPLQLFEQLIEVASDAVRAKLAAENPRARHNIHRVVNDVAARIRAEAASRPPKYATAQVLVEALQSSGRLTADRLEIFAEEGRFEDIVAALALMAKMPADVVERKLNDDSAEFLLVLAKAVGLSWPATKAILALTPRRDRHLLNDAADCQKAFLRLHRPTAQQILDFHRIRETPASSRPM